MPSTKISALTTATSPVAGTVQVPVVQGGETRKATVADIRNSPEPTTLTNQTTIPAAPGAGFTKVYARNRAGRGMLEMIGPSGGDTAFQPALFGNNVIAWFPSNSTATGLGLGSSVSLSGTASHPALGSGGMLSSMRRARLTTAATAGSNAGLRTGHTCCWRGNAAGLGGFFAFFRFAQSTNIEGTRANCGITSNSGTLSAEPSSQIDQIVMGYDSTDLISEGWKLIMCDGTAPGTKITLTGAPRDTTSIYDLTIFAPSNGSSVTVRIVNLTTQTVVLDNVSYTTKIPRNTIFMVPSIQCHNAAVASAQEVELNRWYIESDY